MKRPWLKIKMVSIIFVLGLGMFSVELPLLQVPHKKSVVEAAAPTYITTANVNLRKGPGTKHRVIFTIPKGKNVPYLKKQGKWVQTKYKGKTGYISSRYLKKAKKPSPTTYAAPSTKTPGTYVKGILVVNKKHKLPATYNPGEHKQARKAVNAMIKKAKKDHVRLTAFSTFRSYDRQRVLYNNYVASHGKKQADRFSARPGHSEHQTGLAFDIGGANSKHWAKNSFAKTKEAKWLAKHAHEFGFIIRYPKGKEKWKNP
ncbi:D-alanyl-D-alanine carboxypeptidase family protein [Bacillus sp. 179-C3.3 HS]|uniref:D-alanyl-D-alanine carboxypeptidase family protein n=1 Tax=Bacillus sp. 179-C3.3 HS TaxID=3232162 RepID=UPI0039A3C619